MAGIGEIWRHPRLAAERGIDEVIDQAVIAAVGKDLRLRHRIGVRRRKLCGASLPIDQVGRGDVIALVLVDHREVAHRGAGLTVSGRAQLWNGELAGLDRLVGGLEESYGVAIGDLAEDRAAYPIDAVAGLQAIA